MESEVENIVSLQDVISEQRIKLFERLHLLQGIVRSSMSVYENLESPEPVDIAVLSRYQVIADCLEDGRNDINKLLSFKDDVIQELVEIIESLDKSNKYNISKYFED